MTKTSNWVIPPSTKMHQGPARTFKPQKRKSSGLCRSRCEEVLEVLEDHRGVFKGVEPLVFPDIAIAKSTIDRLL